ncbi:MAG: YciI family protein [Synechococcaceae cyanobacterium]|nr:YciI family protein [Synechococcaceae cyanobacterium]
MKFVLWGHYCDNALEKRTPFREEHLAGLRRQKEEGVLITLGPTETSSHVFGIYEADNREQVEALIQGDVYWRNGIWTRYEIHPWIQAF